jgi:cob(I)alamin adenosyltransferase
MKVTAPRLFIPIITNSSRMMIKKTVLNINLAFILANLRQHPPAPPNPEGFLTALAGTLSKSLAAVNAAVHSPGRMSIATKTGDTGSTSLLFNRRVSKSDARVEACGAVDELNSAIGLARAALNDPRRRPQLEVIQQDLISLMGELATADEDWPKYSQTGFPQLTDANTAHLDGLVREIESQGLTFRGWAIPGANMASATLDVARTVCRRAERRVYAVHEGAPPRNPEVLCFLNRLSDVLWLLAREAEQ